MRAQRLCRRAIHSKVWRRSFSVTKRGRLRRFAVVVIAEAEDAVDARKNLEALLSRGGSRLNIGDACPVGPAGRYETIEIRMTVDGELAVAVPEHP